jgi:hypothetical protein
MFDYMYRGGNIYHIKDACSQVIAMMIKSASMLHYPSLIRFSGPWAEISKKKKGICPSTCQKDSG